MFINSIHPFFEILPIKNNFKLIIKDYNKFNFFNIKKKSIYF